MKFEDNQKTEIVNGHYDCSNSEKWTESKIIPDGYEIIGIYGDQTEDRLKSFGFIIWKPNPDAKK